MRTNMPIKQNRTKEIYSKRVALELRRKGFRMIGTKPSIYKPQFDVYLFESSKELNNAIDEILG